MIPLYGGPFHGLNRSMLKLLSFATLILTVNVFAQSWPVTNSVIKKDPVVEQRIKNLLSAMSLEQKVAQIIQAEIKHISPEDLEEFPLGSILNGGGSFPNDNKFAKISDWVEIADTYYNASVGDRNTIPIMWGTDAVHGHNNVVGATIFPHNIGLGAANNPNLIENIARATALEVLATGIDWVFAPAVSVVRNDRWGRSYEGYSEDPKIVKEYAKIMIQGLQGKDGNIFSENHLVATAKHFIGDGGTENGVDQGNNSAKEEELIRLHAQGYVSAINAGAQTIMASFNSWNGTKIHGYKYLLTNVLKEQMQFDGFVIGDWNGHGQVPGCSNDSCAAAFNAGVDMFMAPEDWKKLFYNTLGQVKSGEINLSRLNDAVTRILRVKIRYGLFELGAPSTRKHAGDERLVGAKNHRQVARQAVRESLVLLKNKNSLLPLPAKSNVLVVGNGADNIGKQSGGWSITWQGTGNANSDFPGAKSIFDGIKSALILGGGSATLSVNGTYIVKPDVAIVVFGEEPYAEGQGDIQNLFFGSRYIDGLILLNKFKSQNIPVISVFLTGRPLWVNPELNASDAFVVAWLPGTEGDGVADVLIENDGGRINFDFKGKLSFSWPNHANQTVLNIGDHNYDPLFPYGFGLTYADVDTLTDNLSEKPFPEGDGSGQNDQTSIFDGRPIDPFKTYVQDSSNPRKEVLAGLGVSTNKVVKAIAVDRIVQEDARQISFNGSENGLYFFESKKTFDLTSYEKTNGALTFYLRRDSQISNPLHIAINDSKIDLTNIISTQALSEWKEITIPLRCYTALGLDLRSLSRSFSIESEGAAQVSLADIKIVSKSNISTCP
jgi:beta-glucosidase